MVYPAYFQPNSWRHVPHTGVQPQAIPQTSTTSWTSIKHMANEFSTSAWELAFRFGQSTTIHGVNRLLSRTSSKYERFVWLLTVVLAFLGSIYVCHILSERFSEGKLETVVDSTRQPVYRIKFPVVTICNLNHLNWQRLEAAKRLFLPRDATLEQLNLFERIIAAYDGLTFGTFDAFASLQGDPVEQLNHVNFSLVDEFMTWRCEELLTSCVWNRFHIDCCEVFSKRRGKNGLCWAFNTLETDEGRHMQMLDSMWPWHTGAAGPGSGLMVRVLTNPEKHYPNRTNEKGISVMISEPLVWHKDPMIVPQHTQTMIEVEPVIYFYDNNTRALSSKLRQCVFNDEQNSIDFKSLYGYIYMIENCQAECHQEYLMRFCNCTVDLLFPPGPYPSCKASDMLCLAKYNERFLYSHKTDEEQYVRNYHEGMVCECFRNCYSLNYLADARPSFLSPEVRGNLSYVDLDVHFRFETMMVYRTSLIFGWVDLMVAFGGIVGLFLGCSLISTIELAYFLFVDLPSFVFRKYQTHKRKRQAHPQKQQNIKHVQQINVKTYTMPITHLTYPSKLDRKQDNALMNDWQARIIE